MPPQLTMGWPGAPSCPAMEGYPKGAFPAAAADIAPNPCERGGANKKCGESDSKCDVCSDPVAVRKESRVADKVVEKKQEQGAYDALEKRMEQARAKAKERENEKRTKEKGKENSVTPPRVPGKRKFIYPVKT